MQRILIIGAGLVGAALAYRLSRAGAPVTVLDAGPPASAASGASFGWINASFFHSPAHFNLRAEGIRAHHRLDRDLGDTGTRWQGCLWWEEADLDLQAHRPDRPGLPGPDARRDPDRRPRTRPRRPAERCLFFPDEGAVDAAHLTRRLLAASGATPAQRMPGPAIETHGGRATGVHTDQGFVPADHVVLAAGTGSPACWPRWA